MFDTSGLGADQYIVYGRLVPGGVVADEWFHRGVDLSFVARPAGRDVKRDFRCSWGTPLGMGSCRAKQCSLDAKLLGSRVYHQGGLSTT